MIFRKNKKFTEEYDRYYPVIFSSVCVKVADLDDAHDICQEVFIDFYNKIDEIQDARKWLYGAMRFEVMAYYKKKSGKDVSVDDVFNDIGLTFVNGFRDVRIIIQEALDASGNYGDVTEKDLVDLISVHKFSYEEAGALLGLTKRQARYKYAVAVKRILDHLEKKGIKSLEELL